MTTPTLPARLLAAKFRKRPLVIEAIQYIFDGTTRFADEAQDDIADFMGQNIVVVGDNIEIQTPEGPIYASPGDWIIRGVAGEFYPCKPDIFTATYEAEAAAALSAPEGDMARALEWLRGFGWVVPDTVKSAIEEAIAAYDPERAGAYSGKLSGREAVATVTGNLLGHEDEIFPAIRWDRSVSLPVGSKLYTTPPAPVDVRVPMSRIIELLAQLVNAPQTDDEFDADVIRRDVVMEKVTQLRMAWDELSKAQRAMLTAAPSAKGV